MQHSVCVMPLQHPPVLCSQMLSQACTSFAAASCRHDVRRHERPRGHTPLIALPPPLTLSPATLQERLQRGYQMGACLSTPEVRPGLVSINAPRLHVTSLCRRNSIMRVQEAPGEEAAAGGAARVPPPPLPLPATQQQAPPPRLPPPATQQDVQPPATQPASTEQLAVVVPPPLNTRQVMQGRGGAAGRHARPGPGGRRLSRHHRADEGHVPDAGGSRDSDRRAAALCVARRRLGVQRGPHGCLSHAAAAAAAAAGLTHTLCWQLRLLGAHLPALATHASPSSSPPSLPLPGSFCDFTLVPETPTLLVVEDASQDARFRTNAYVAGEPGIRFCAGAPLVSTAGGHIYGANRGTAAAASASARAGGASGTLSHSAPRPPCPSPLPPPQARCACLILSRALSTHPSTPC